MCVCVFMHKLAQCFVKAAYFSSGFGSNNNLLVVQIVFVLSAFLFYGCCLCLHMRRIVVNSATVLLE